MCLACNDILRVRGKDCVRQFPAKIFGLGLHWVNMRGNNGIPFLRLLNNGSGGYQPVAGSLTRAAPLRIIKCTSTVIHSRDFKIST